MLMLAVTVDRQGAMSGTLLGEFILVQIEGFHYAIVGIGFGLAALSLANSLLTGVLERRREIGVLKAVGWQTGTVARLFLAEGVWLGLLGGLTGALVGLVTFVALYESASTSLVWIGLVGVLTPTLVAALAALYPARVAARVPPAEAVRYE
ncbi:MAG TPA: ABC transporter permease [Chloroflexota bacterium]|nr:ABC transporter permease [Chloroflexota bacterium]